MKHLYGKLALFSIIGLVVSIGFIFGAESFYAQGLIAQANENIFVGITGVIALFFFLMVVAVMVRQLLPRAPRSGLS